MHILKGINKQVAKKLKIRLSEFLLCHGIQKAQHLGLENTIAEIWDDGKKAEIELAAGEPSLLAAVQQRCAFCTELKKITDKPCSYKREIGGQFAPSLPLKVALIACVF